MAGKKTELFCKLFIDGSNYKKDGAKPLKKKGSTVLEKP